MSPTRNEIEKLQAAYDSRMRRRKMKKVGIKYALPDDVKLIRYNVAIDKGYLDQPITMTIKRRKTPPPVVGWRQEGEEV